jgi:hypothetical protein
MVVNATLGGGSGSSPVSTGGLADRSVTQSRHEATCCFLSSTKQENLGRVISRCARLFKEPPSAANGLPSIFLSS